MMWNARYIRYCWVMMLPMSLSPVSCLVMTTPSPSQLLYCSSTSKEHWYGWIPPPPPHLSHADSSDSGNKNLDIQVEWTPTSSEETLLECRERRIATAARHLVEQAAADRKLWRKNPKRPFAFLGNMLKNGNYPDDGCDMLQTQRQQQDEIANSLRLFEEFCWETFRPELIHRFRARIVGTRGKQGTKCPKWHTDYVPVRWIQSLVGPGCCIRGDRSRETHTATGKAMVLPGQYWNDCLQRDLKKQSRTTSAVVHKSPDLRFPWQPRLLLTIDMDILPSMHSE